MKPPPVWALIPGIAPGLVAIFPQLLILAVAMLGLVLSPRSWWRFIRYAARHPVRVLVACAAPLLAVFLLVQAIAALAPSPAASPRMPEVPGGFPPGDRHASGSFIASAGALSRPEPTRIELDDPAELEAPGEWIEAWGKAIRIDADRRSLAAIDPALGRVIWNAALDEPLACRPLPFERLAREGADAGLVAITLAPSADAGARLIVLDARDGSRRGAQDMPGRPGAAAIVDERLLVALEDAITCLRLEPDGRAVPLWRGERTQRRAVSLAGDECGRYYLLDEAELSVGALDGGAAVRLAGYEGETPRALAVRHGLAYVIVEDAAGFRVEGLEPSLRGAGSRSPVRWSRRAPAPLGPRMAIGSEGIVLTTREGIVLLDAFGGATLRETVLEPGPVCPAAVTDGSAFVLLSDGSAVRVLPESGREAWRLPGSASDGRPESRGTASLIACGSQLVVETTGAARVLASPVAGGRSFGHWRGGASRRGTAADAEAPLTGKELWRRPLGDDRGSGRSILPIPGGCLVIRSGLAASEIRAMSWTEETPRVETIPGDIRGAVHHDERLFIALEDAGAGRVLCRRLAAASERPRALWSASVPALSRRAVIAAGGEIVVVGSADGARALSARSGAALWHRPGPRGAAAPIIDGDRVFMVTPGADGSAGELAALRASDGSPLWTRPGEGAGWGPPALLDERLFAALGAAGDLRLLALDARNGSTLWQAAAPDAVLDVPVAASHSEIVVGLESGAALVVSASGEVRGATQVPSAAGAPHLVVLVGALVVGSSSEIGCFDTFGVERLWKVAVQPPVEDLVFHEGRILALAGGALVAVGAE